MRFEDGRRMKFASRALTRSVLHSASGSPGPMRELRIERYTEDTPPKMLKPAWVVRAGRGVQSGRCRLLSAWYWMRLNEPLVAKVQRIRHV